LAGTVRVSVVRLETAEKPVFCHENVEVNVKMDRSTNSLISGESEAIVVSRAMYKK
jgi:hypothetical protein